MTALIVSGKWQEKEPHPGLDKFANKYLADYMKLYRCYSDCSFDLEGVDIIICHSFGAFAVYQNLLNFKEDRIIKCVFWDLVTENCSTFDWAQGENIDIHDRVEGLSVLKERGMPRSCDVKGQRLSSIRHNEDHNSIVNSDEIQREVAEAMGLI